MKTLKFKAEYVPLIVNGEMTTTWRLFDDKDLHAGDVIAFINKETGENFARAEIWNVSQKKFKDLNSEDGYEHEDVGQGERMLRHYRSMYNRPVDEDTPVKIVKFRLLS
jgi:hypothetical protein